MSEESSLRPCNDRSTWELSASALASRWRLCGSVRVRYLPLTLVTFMDRLMYMSTNDKLKEMLRENTGTSILDSGDHYGRNWQLNRARDFDSEPATALSYRYGYLEVTLNVYHWLGARLDYCPEFDAMLQAWREHNEDMCGFEAAVEWADVMGGRGIYGEGSPVVVNTCNHESLLSQVVQYVHTSLPNGREFVILQIHGGCDVRGGYTDPVVFECSPNYELGILCEDSRAHIGCTECDASWSTDDAGQHWYSDNGPGQQNLEDYPTSSEDDGQVWEEGHVWVDTHDAPHCPECGAKLEASA